MEKILAESFLEISQNSHEDCGIKTYHIPYLPRRIYIEAPGIVRDSRVHEVFGLWSPSVSCHTHIGRHQSQFFAQRSRRSLPWVMGPNHTGWASTRATLPLFFLRPSEGDVVSIAVVPRFKISQNKKRKGKGRAAPHFLTKKFWLKFPPMKKISIPLGLACSTGVD
jgi:hypothetical protein